ncbi:AI-2E family transporter [Trueperella pecoris]|uniref:AI-2E family transporter n=1 Tax=Trueperella pecoris TaxID=2733571 RepID=A0A7M1QV30_9ACTO|nr:AI-2E family transporter [Trueperella pecoris]QOQ39722.1 AI-2E family transporter [Trueperella pecoris]QOR45651.1 AI-2E family transporter [Trueperella pecoris]QTG75492.1 AI-2E family transporter [Trueperella pecoris]
MTNQDLPMELPPEEAAPVAETPKPETHVDSDSSGLMILVALALMTVAGAGLNYIAPVFTPIFLALTLVLAVRPIGQRMIRRGAPSWLAATVVIAVLVFIVFGLLGVAILLLTPVPQTLVHYSINFEKTTQQLNQLLTDFGMDNVDLSKFVDQINFNSLVGVAWEIVDRLSSVGGLIMIVIVTAFFITIDTTITKGRGAIVNKRHANIARAMSDFERRVRSYWVITTVFGLIVAIVDGFALQVMAVPLAWTWAYWAFITNYIPNIGFIIGVFPPMVMALLDQGWQSMVWVLVLYSVINVVFQTFLQPKFTGDVVGLSPSVTFISLVLWTVIVGILGSILAVPLTLFFKALLVDSDPRARWLDAYLISEQHIVRKEKQGAYTVPKDDKPRGDRRKMHLRARNKRAKK